MESRPEGGIVKTPYMILIEAVTKTNELDQKADENLEDVNNRINILRQRAQVVADLPKTIIEAEIQSGRKLPTAQFDTIKDLSQIAQEALISGGGFSLSVLLHEQGSKIGDPNMLEQVVNSLTPKKKK